jgi:RNA polymerase sigma-70 factor (ECF subfamily)
MSSHPRQDLLRTALVHAPALTRFLASQVSDVSEAQDLMQEVYLRILKLRDPESIRSPKAYLFTVAAKIAYEHRLRRDTRPLHYTFDNLPEELLRNDTSNGETADADPPLAAAALAERLHHLGARLSELSPKVQAAILWHHHDGYTCDEIAERLSVVTHRVKKYLTKGLAHCRAPSPVFDAAGRVP